MSFQEYLSFDSDLIINKGIVLLYVYKKIIDNRSIQIKISKKIYEKYEQILLYTIKFPTTTNRNKLHEYICLQYKNWFKQRLRREINYITDSIYE